MYLSVDATSKNYHMKKTVRADISLSLLLGIPKDDDDRVTTKKHLADKAISVDGKSFLLSFPSFRYLSPHFPDIFKNHVAVPVESPNTAKEFPVVAAVDQHLSVVLNTHHQNRKGSGVELLLFGFPVGILFHWPTHVGLKGLKPG